MSDNSDQFATPEEEAAFHQEIIETDDVPSEAIEDEVIEHDESDEEPEDDAEPVQKKKAGFVEFTTPEQKARVAQITREKHENARKVEALERELEQYKKEPEPPKEAPMPTADPITEADLFIRQQQAREQYVRDSVKFEADVESRNKQIADTQQKQHGVLVDTYNKNATKLKINPTVLLKASEVCSDYGINQQSNKALVEHLLEDPDGPAIVAYLGANVDTLAEIAGMTPAKAGAYIEREIRAKLNVRKQSKAPPPQTKVSGTRAVAKGADGWSIS